MSQVSAGLLLYRINDRVIEVFLIHPGGPFWFKKDLGVWSIPKGIVERGENALNAARREFNEETGFTVSTGTFVPLTPIKLTSGKIIQAWALEGNCDARNMKSNNFTMEWPPHSGKLGTFPEADRSAWFGLEEAVRKISKGQRPLLEELKHLVAMRHCRTLRSESE
jgi:predicted NUDIX family NTP pyrophosphohydrolase